MKIPYFSCLITAFLLSAPGVQAQESRQRQHEVMQDLSPPEREEEQEPILFEDDEFGEQLILRRPPPPPLLSIFGGGAGGFSSNPLLLPDGSQNDYLFIGTLGAALQPNVFREWEPALSVEFFGQYQLFRYDRFADLDFDAQTAGFSASYTLPHRMKAYGGWTGSRLVDVDERDRFFQESQTTLGLSSIFREEDDVALFGGAQVDLRNTSPSDLSRLDYGPYVGARILLHDRVPMSLRYAFNHQHYLETGRDDLNSRVTLSFRWHIRRALTLRLQTNWASNSSNNDANEYDLVTSRFGVNLSHAF